MPSRQGYYINSYLPSKIRSADQESRLAKAILQTVKNPSWFHYLNHKSEAHT